MNSHGRSIDEWGVADMSQPDRQHCVPAPVITRVANLEKQAMAEPTITCPDWRTEIKLTESLAAPLIADTRKHYERELAQKEVEVAHREAAIREQRAEIAKARNSISAEVATKLDEERKCIAAEEAHK